MNLVEKLQWRYATQKFDSARKISDSEWQALEHALVLTPSSYGLQPWKFVVVQKPEVRKELRAASWNQAQVEEASHFVVFCALNKLTEDWVDRYIKTVSEIRDVPVESLQKFRAGVSRDLITGPRAANIHEWAARQVYIALGNFMTAAAVLNIDTCPMEGLNPDKYDEILNLKGSGFSTLVACAAGYRSSDDKYATAKKVRFPLKDVIDYY